MRILALDFGSKRIGLAVSDETHTLATGISTINRKDNKTDISRLRQIVEEFNIGKIILGITYNTDGSLTKTGEEAKNFSRLINRHLSVPIEFFDETYTTANAERLLLEADMGRKKRKRIIDKLSAVMILQEYLNNT